jgi:hypothetical protein
MYYAIFQDPPIVLNVAVIPNIPFVQVCCYVSPFSRVSVVVSLLELADLK